MCVCSIWCVGEIGTSFQLLFVRIDCLVQKTSTSSNYEHNSDSVKFSSHSIDEYIGPSSQIWATFQFLFVILTPFNLNLIFFFLKWQFLIISFYFFINSLSSVNNVSLCSLLCWSFRRHLTFFPLQLILVRSILVLSVFLQYNNDFIINWLIFLF